MGVCHSCVCIDAEGILHYEDSVLGAWSEYTYRNPMIIGVLVLGVVKCLRTKKSALYKTI